MKLRQDFSETTFFLPELKTDSKGQVSWSFNAPEQLSRWRLVLNAHSRTLDHHIERRTVETSREFSIRPTLPRFVREGDAATLVTEVRNESPKAQYGTLTLELFDPREWCSALDPTADLRHRRFISYDPEPPAGGLSWSGLRRRACHRPW